MKIRKRSYSLFFMQILLMSMVLPSLVRAAEGSDLTLSYQTGSFDEENEWSWNDMGWEFGPRADFSINYANGTEINTNNEEFMITSTESSPTNYLFNAYIPDAIFAGRANRSLGSADIWCEYTTNDQNPGGGGGEGASWENQPTLQARLGLQYFNVNPCTIWECGDWVENDPNFDWDDFDQFSCHQEQINGTGMNGEFFESEEEAEGVTNGPQGADWWDQTNFFELNLDECTAVYDESGEAWNITWVGYFNEETYVGGYRFNLGINTNKGEYISAWGFSAWESGESPEKFIGIGEYVEQNMHWGFGASWGFEKLNLNNNSINTIGIEDNWIMRFNISDEIDFDVGNANSEGMVCFGFNLMDWYGNKTVETGYHQEQVQHTGGWVYNETTDSYSWDTDVQFETMEHVYGEYEWFQWIGVPPEESHWFEVEVDGWGWNWETNEMEYGTFTHWVNERLYLIWNASTDSFSAKVGYDFWQQTSEWESEMVYVFQDVDVTDVTENIYNLAEENCSRYSDAENNQILDFMGYFTESLSSMDQDEFWFDTRVLNSEGREEWMGMGNWDNQRIGIDKPVAKSYIIGQDGVPVMRDAFIVEPEEWFRVQSRLDGPDSFWESIDGISVELRCWEDKWTPEQQEWSEIQLISTYDFDLQEQTSAGYNMTQKYNETYSTYWDWVEVEMDGWHWEYNPDLGYDEWVDGEYFEWQWNEVEGWHWQQWTYNQKDQVWFQGWLPWRSEETEIQDIGQIVEIYSVNKSKNDLGEWWLDINMTIKDGAPDAVYDWEIRFQNKEFGEDWERPWGEYDCFTWLEDDIFYYELGEGGARIMTSEPQSYEYIYADVGDGYQYYEIADKPYVEIDGEKIPIKVSTSVDWQGQLEEKILYQMWDWQTQEDEMYYKRANDSEHIDFEQKFSANIYNVTIGGETLLTFQQETHWMGEGYGLVDIDGDRHIFGDDWEYQTGWNVTGGNWQHYSMESDQWYNYSNCDSRIVNNENNIDKIQIDINNIWDHELQTHFAIIGGEWVEVNEGWFRWDFGDQYVTLTDGTNLKLYEPSDSVVSGITESEGAAQGAYRVVYYNGAWEWIADGIINGFYADGGDYDGTFVPINYGNYGGGWQDILMSRYVHEKDGELFDIPFPGAVCNGNWMLESTVSGLQRWGGTQYGIVPVDKYAIINGIACPIENITKAGESVNGSFVYDGTIYTDVTMGIDIAVVINNSANFNITQIGYQVPYGTNEYDRWQFDTEGTMLVDADDHIFDQYWNYQNLGDYNGLYNSTEDNDGGFYLTNVSSGEKINITRMGILPIYNVSIVDSWEWPNTILEDNLSALRSWWFWDGPYRRLCLANGTWLNYTDDFVNIEVIGEDHIIANCENYSIVIEDYQTNERYNWTEINPWNWDFNFTWEFEGETYNAREDTHFVNNWGHDEWFRDIQLAWMVEIDGEWKEIKDPNYQWEWSPSGQQYVRANNWYSVYNVTFDGYNNYTIISNSSYIYKKSTVLGHPTGNFLRDQNVMNMRDVNRFVVGTPEYDMWGLRLWWTTDTGALDLDGDMSTTHDQYFVAKNYSNTNNFEHHREYMDVSVEYDPDTAVAYNSMEIRSNIALNTMTWSCDWSEYFNWFYADNFTLLSTPEMEAIQDKISDTSTRQAKPGYWDIARMAYNRTAEDIKAEAEAMGWWWMEEDEQVWTWMEFNLDQDYWADFYDDDGDIESSLIQLKYEFSGFMLYNDTNDDGYMQLGGDSAGTTEGSAEGIGESVSSSQDGGEGDGGGDVGMGSESEVSHFFLPATVDSVEFFKPSSVSTHLSNETDEDDVTTTIYPGDSKIDWGVNFLEINGTTYPFDEMNMRSMWGWYDGGLDTEQMRTFADKPTEVSIENLRLSVHFQGESDKESEEANFETSIKIDQEIGNWNTDIRGGRENFENYSLSLSYYVYSIAWRSDTISEEDFEYSEEGEGPPPEGEEGKEPPPEGSAGVLEVQEELRAIEVTLGSAQDGEDGEGPPPDGEGPPPDGEDGGEGGGYEGGGSGEGDSVVLDDEGNEVDNDAQTLSENYSMVESSASGVFAKAELGSAYTWDKNKSMSLNVSSFTAPISTFKGAFSSGDSGKSCTNFAFQGELYFLSVGFSKWDGYAVYNDPTFTSFVGATEHEFGPGDSSNGGMDFLLPAIAIGAACIVGVIFIILKKRKGGGGGDFNIEPTF